MIHMIFQFFLESGDFGFFVKRVKNIAQSKMCYEGDKIRMENGTATVGQLRPSFPGKIMEAPREIPKGVRNGGGGNMSIP